ncbi:MAG: acyl-CoA dehydrogenase [Actinomycetia bacterium]|nr:acyl-CoA dehydrogenase [Actinomycetes bacterium]
MNLDLPDEVLELARSVDRAVADAGSVDLTRAAELDPSVRTSVAAPIVAALGLADLDVTADADAAVAGAEVCRVAGNHAFPFPLAAMLAGQHLESGHQLGLVGPGHPRVDHGDLGHWLVADTSGSRFRATPVAEPLGSKLGPFVVDVALEPLPGPLAPAELALALDLVSFTILGYVERARALAVEHVTTRVQFGQTLSKFQGVRFQIADVSVLERGLRELARFTISRVLSVAPDDAMADSLALRVAALEAATEVFRVAHQLHGAVGFCDEHDLSILSRHVQPLVRLPVALEATTQLLVDSITRSPFDSLFSAAAGA